LGLLRRFFGTTASAQVMILPSSPTHRFLSWLNRSGRIRENQGCRVPRRARLISLLPQPTPNRPPGPASTPEQKKEAGELREALRCLLSIESFRGRAN
jgi:hypothetical protein